MFFFGGIQRFKRGVSKEFDTVRGNFHKLRKGFHKNAYVNTNTSNEHKYEQILREHFYLKKLHKWHIGKCRCMVTYIQYDGYISDLMEKSLTISWKYERTIRSNSFPLGREKDIPMVVGVIFHRLHHSTPEELIACVTSLSLLEDFWSSAQAGYINFSPPLERPFLRSSGSCKLSILCTSAKVLEECFSCSSGVSYARAGRGRSGRRGRREMPILGTLWESMDILRIENQVQTQVVEVRPSFLKRVLPIKSKRVFGDFGILPTEGRRGSVVEICARAHWRDLAGLVDAFQDKYLPATRLWMPCRGCSPSRDYHACRGREEERKRGSKRS
ncbi:hypothetical protein CsSME_00022679 [Camellia sinensis var. sinensis]